MKLRDYQLRASDLILESWKENRSALVVMPTGTGKTVLFADIIRRSAPLRTMVIAHRQELIWQAVKKIRDITGLEVDVEMGEHKVRQSRSADVIVSSIQTQIAGGDGGGRKSKFDPAEFGRLIVDEAHHAISPSYRKAIDYYASNPDLKLLGVTATPDRADEAALGQVFDIVAFDYELSEAIFDGWLVPIMQQAVEVESLDFSGVRTTAGDLNGADLAAIMEAEKNLHGIASATLDIISGGQRGIGFASSVAHASALCEIFNRHRPGMSAFIYGGTPQEERETLVKGFTEGKIQWLWNCSVFTEGFDVAGVQVIAMARPTKSRSLYAQMVGRSTRPHESIAHILNESPIAVLRRQMIARSAKPSALVIDFAGNSGRHRLVTAADFLGGDYSDEAIENVTTAARRAGKPIRVAEALEDEERRLEEAKRKRLEAEARKANLVGKARYTATTIDPFEFVGVKPNKERGWHAGKVLSEKQRTVVRRAGQDPDALGFAKAKQLIDIIFGRLQADKCTLKQAQLLAKNGYDRKEALEMTFKQARETIDRLAANGWQKPKDLVPAVEDDAVPF